jgi:FkbM family methyltransferase
MKRIAKRVQGVLRRFGYHVGRLPANRFVAMEDTLRGLRHRGFQPDLIIDAGANVGRWAQLADRIFPDVELHLVEPQPGCHAELRRLAARHGRCHLHAVALAPPGVSVVAMVGTSETGRSEGAWVNRTGRGDFDMPAATLDALFATKVAAARRPLLKLDLEGYELPALAGALQVLPQIEILISEVNFFDIEGSGMTVFGDLTALMRDAGFTLYDFAALAGRPRDGRLSLGDAVYVRNDSELLRDVRWH